MDTFSGLVYKMGFIEKKATTVHVLVVLCVPMFRSGPKIT